MTDFRDEIDQLNLLIRNGFDRLGSIKASLWSTLMKYSDLLPSQLVEDFVQLEMSLNEIRESPISVLVAGISKAGKSSTANAIVEEDEFFPTGAVRKTDRVSKKEWNGIVIVDTPGIDSIEDIHDEQVLKKELSKADLVIFLFSDKEGELDRIAESFLVEHLLPSKEVLFLMNKKRDD